MLDIRYALRQLARSPGFTVAALATLSVGFGACVAIFSVVDSVLLRPLPYLRSERLVAVKESFPPRFPQFPVAPGHYFDWVAQSTSFDELAAFQTADGVPGRETSYALTGLGEPLRVSAARVTANVFPTLGVAPMLGRGFVPDEDAPGRENVVVLSQGFWARHLGARADVLGRKLELDGRSFEIVGVMPRGFALEGPVDLYIPAAFTGAERQSHGGSHVIEVIGRLKNGVSLADARREMAVISERLAAQFPETSRGWGVILTPLLEARVSDVKAVLFSLLGAVALLLVIACANVANLLLVRATARSKEIAVRAALGATPARVVRQLLTESVVLAVLAGTLGVLLAQWGLDVLAAVVPDGIPRAQEIALDGRAIALACGLVLAAAIGFGMAPAVQAARVRLNEVLQEGGRGTSTGARRQRLRGLLVIAQIAVALMLLAGAGLLIRSFAGLAAVSPGFRPDGALAASVALSRTKYDTDAKRLAFADQVAARIAALPGVDVGVSASLPFSGDVINVVQFKVAGRAVTGDLPTTNVFQVNPGYFKAMGVPLLRGRGFDDHDGANTPPVVLISDSLARKLFAGEDPIGKRIAAVTGGPDVWNEIVGVVGDVKLDRLDAEATLQTYTPFARWPWPSFTFVVRSASGATAAGLPAAIRDAIRSVDGKQPITSIRPLRALVAASMARQRFAMLLFAVFSGVALLLAAIGINGVMAYAVALRAGEIGIRMALGAQVGDVLWLLATQAARLVAVGLVAGLIGAAVLTRFLDSLLYGVSARDLVTFAGAALLVCVVSAAACLVPALRAARVNPMVALRA